MISLIYSLLPHPACYMISNMTVISFSPGILSTSHMLVVNGICPGPYKKSRITNLAITIKIISTVMSTSSMLRSERHYVNVLYRKSALRAVHK